MITVLIIHALAALVCLMAGDRLGRAALIIGAAGPVATLFVFFAWFSGGEATLVEDVAWVPAVGLDLAFRVDGLAALMTVLIGGVGVLVFAYSWFYFGKKPGVGRFSGYLVIFAGSMVGLVTADNFLLLFVFWELTSVMSYLLIGFNDTSASARASALQALLVTAAAGLVMLAGVVLLAQAGGTYSLSGLLADPPSGGLVGVGLALILVGAFAKSAQFPLHFWLPGAMAAPTPVSAYLHSATMVKGGIYLVARLAPVYALLLPWWRPTLAIVGVLTMLVGGWRALAQTDLKLLLAHGTVSQLGFIMALVGMGVPALTFAGMAMILAHSVFKGALFMVAGVVESATGTRDIRRLSGVGREMPMAFAVAAISIASMVGLPPLLGFVTKEAALESLVGHGSVWLTALVVLASMLTVAYGLRFMNGAFATKDHDPSPVAAVGFGFLAPAALLAGVTVVAGVVPGLVDGLVSASAASVSPGTSDYHLALWHGFGVPLALSAAALGGGWLVWRMPLRRLRKVTGSVPDAARVYAGVLNGITRIADRTTAIVQSGSLPVYLLIIVSVAVIGPGILAARHWRVFPDMVIAESSLQAVAALLVMGAAIGAIVARRRLGAVLLLGAVGYGVAVLFVIQGAPDLALTQLLIETLALALFVFVLSRLPVRFEAVQSRVRKWSRVGVSVAAGLMAMAMSLWAVSERIAPSLAPEFMARSLPEGGGRNVVNVILTDFRALDTLGEITVLAIAAMGVIALVRSRLPDDVPIDDGTGGRP